MVMSMVASIATLLCVGVRCSTPLACKLCIMCCARTSPMFNSHKRQQFCMMQGAANILATTHAPEQLYGNPKYWYNMHPNLLMRSIDVCPLHSLKLSVEAMRRWPRVGRAQATLWVLY